MYPDGGRGEGFSVVALQCILIEFFEAFYEGKTFTTKKKNILDDEYNSSYEVYKNFLTTHSPFLEFFCNHDNDNQPAQPNQCSLISAELFYKKFRCGLLHEAATKGKAMVRAEKKDSEAKSLDPHHEILIEKLPDGGIALYRLPFQKALENYIQDYKRKLLDSLDQRKAFCRKMDELCQL